QGQNIIPAIKNWTVAWSIEDMDKAGVEKAMMSVTTPGLWFESNERAQDRAPRQRLRRQDARRSSRPVRHFHRAAAARRRRRVEGDRVRLRRTQGGRRRSYHQLWQQMARRSGVRSGARGTESPQGGRLRSSDLARLLPQHRAGRA